METFCAACLERMPGESWKACSLVGFTDRGSGPERSESLRGHPGLLPEHRYAHHSPKPLDCIRGENTPGTMATPVFTLRLPPQDRKNLEQVSRICGFPSAGSFASFTLGAICSGDEKRLQEYLANLVRGISGQLSLQLIQQPVWKAVKGARRGKRPLRRPKRP
jgi:hypothetical protein